MNVNGLVFILLSTLCGVIIIAAHNKDIENNKFEDYDEIAALFPRQIGMIAFGILMLILSTYGNSRALR